MRAITLDEIAEATKIGTRSLRALEEEKFDQLPGGIFNKGFIRAYARYLGLDEDQAVADYMTASAECAANKTTNLTVLAAQVEEQRAREAKSSEGRLRFLASVAAVALIAALAGTSFWLWQRHKALQAAESEQPAPVQAAQTPYIPSVAQQTPAAVPDSTTGNAAVDATTAQPASGTNAAQVAPAVEAPKAEVAPVDGVKVSLKATQKAWVSVTADGKPVFQAILDPASANLSGKSFQAKERLSLVVGNAGGIEASFNGKDLGALGPEGQPRRLTFTPAGLESR